MTMQSEISLQASPFADDFVDVAALNGRISTHLLDRVESVRRAALAGVKVPSSAVAILGPAGGGKTHLFSRLTHHSGPRPTLVLLRPYFGVHIALRDVLAAIVDQLCLPVHGAHRTQLEIIVSYWLSASDDVDGAVSAIVSSLPEIAPAAHLARALLQLGEREAPTAWGELAWLSGREPRAGSEGTSAAALGEGDVLHMLRILSIVAAPVAPIVLTFDQLENLAGDDDARVLGYGNLVSEIVDSLPCFTIVQLALTSEWMQIIEPRLTLPQKTRVAREVLVLEAPDRQERELLLRAWHGQVVAREGGRRKRRFPSPLSEDELNELLSAPGMTPRLLLAALSRVVSGQPMAIVAPSPAPSRAPGDANGSGVETLWTSELARVGAELEDKERSGLPFDAAELAEGLASSLTFVPRLEVATRTERDRIVTWVKAPGSELAVLYLTSLHHGSVAATLGKAIELASQTKVVIVREKRFEFPPTWGIVDERRSAFERLPNARWLWLERDDLARWLGLGRLLSKARSKKLHVPGADEPLSAGVVRDALLRAHAPDEWPSVAAIARWLSDIPRETPSLPAVREPVRREAPPSQPAPRPPPPPPPTLRAWLSLGRDLGRSTVSRYVEKVRALVGRSDE